MCAIPLEGLWGACCTAVSAQVELGRSAPSAGDHLSQPHFPVESPVSVLVFCFLVTLPLSHGDKIAKFRREEEAGGVIHYPLSNPVGHANAGLYGCLHLGRLEAV